MRHNKQMLGLVSRTMTGQTSGGDARFFSNVERATPVRSPDMTPDVLVPLCQMGVVFVGALCFVFPIALFLIDPMGALCIALALAGIAAGITTFFVLDWKHTTIYAMELYRDNLTATSTTAKTVTEEIKLTVVREDISPNFPPVQNKWLDIDSTQFRELAQAAIEGAAITQAAWVGTDKPFSRSEFDRTTEALMEVGILAWRNAKDPAQGRVITAGGRHALSAMLDGRAQARTQADNRQ